MKISVVSLFPEMFEAISRYGISGRAVERGLLELSLINPRLFTSDRHQTVDHRPYGGGPGMVMMAEPLRQALAEARAQVAPEQGGETARVIYMSPQGRPLDQAGLEHLAAKPLVILAGRYEGVDERLLASEIDEEWSLGDYVLSGGELPAMTVIDGICRLLPGALGHAQSAVEDSFVDGLLDCPHYTRPETYRGESVPPVLLSGDHENIRLWRLKQSLGRTWQRRPDLLEKRLEKKPLTEQEQALLAEYQRENQQ